MRAFLSLRGAKRRGNLRPLWVRSPSQKWGTDSHGGLRPPRNDRTGNGWADHPDRCLTVGAGSKPARVIFPTEPVAMGRGAPACAPGIVPTAGRHTGRSLPVEMGWTEFGSPSGGAGAASAVPERALSAPLRGLLPQRGRRSTRQFLILQYSTLSSHRPWAGARKPARARSRQASRSGMEPGSRRP